MPVVYTLKNSRTIDPLCQISVHRFSRVTPDQELFIQTPCKLCVIPISGLVCVTYTSPGSHSFEVPAGITELTVEVWGAGGSGGGAEDFANRAGGGGGGGGYAKGVISVIPGEFENLFVGDGGSYNGSEGEIGETSYFRDAGTLRATGGGAGETAKGLGSNAGGLGGLGSGSAATVTFLGGNGGNGGNLSVGGGGGGSARSTSNGDDGTDGNDGGLGGLGSGNGGDGGSAGLDGSNGNDPGGGGGGAGGQGDGLLSGRGGIGQVKVCYLGQ